MNISTEAQRALRDMDRDHLVKLMESHGYQVYDHESEDELRENIRIDLESGEIPEDELFVSPAQLPDCRDR
jgi:hypothetical protein